MSAEKQLYEPHESRKYEEKWNKGSNRISCKKT